MLALAAIIIFGILAQWVAWKFKVPAILPLIIVGLLVGPIAEGLELIGWGIKPITDGKGGGLVPSDTLFGFVSLAIGVILFEGGLTLRRNEIKGVGSAILRLISVGSLVTLVLGTLAAHYIMGLNINMAVLFAALIVVTGPTVIAPILRNVPLNRNVATVLKWEGILIDPVGALTAVLLFEFLFHDKSITNLGELLVDLHLWFGVIKVVVIGAAAGWLGATFLHIMLKKHLVPHYLLNVFTLALVVAVFSISDILASESGLLSVVVMGIILGNRSVPYIEDILDFKESLTILLISILFIILSANISWAQLLTFKEPAAWALLAVVIFVIRPIGVFLSTMNSELSLNEKIFISWVGPRGIVAAGIASLFGISLVKEGVPSAEYLTPLVFLVVLGTVVLNATTARLVARWLGVTLEGSNGIVIIGANTAARIIGKYLTDNKRHIILIDNSSQNIDLAKQEGIEAIQKNIFDETLDDNFELLDMGYLIALSGSDSVNLFACETYRKYLGENGTYRILTEEEVNGNLVNLPADTLFSPITDYTNLSKVVHDYPYIHEHPLKDEAHLQDLLRVMNFSEGRIPIFLKNTTGNLELIPSNHNDINMLSGDRLVYLGKKYDVVSSSETTDDDKATAAVLKQEPM